jgi:predicted N-acetyltransferase YhbS
MGFEVRLASNEDLASLEAIELLAAERFNTAEVARGLEKRTVPFSQLRAAQAVKELWIAQAAEGEIVGFLLAEPLDGNLHITEMSVIPSHGRQGVGATLINAAVKHAKAASYRGVTLTTFASVPWNGPFYVKQGFREMVAAEIGVGLAARP